MRLVAAVLDCIQDLTDRTAGGSDTPGDHTVITGALSTFDSLPPEKRRQFLALLTESGVYDEAFPEVLRAALLPYCGLPARWLFEHQEITREYLNAELEAALRPVVFDSIHGQSDVATKAKVMVVRSYLQAGKLHLPESMAREWFPILAKYPTAVTDEEKQRIEPSMRAAYLNLIALGNNNEAPPSRLKWAELFWQQNWQKYDCERSVNAGITEENHDAATLESSHRSLSKEVSRLHGSALAICEMADPNLYLPDKHEVLTGLVFRQIEAVRAMINSPALWHVDQAAGITRGLIETRITLKWMLTQDPAIFLKFKEYGRGKLKLYKLHMEELRDALDHKSEQLDKEIDQLQELVNGDIYEEFQDISIAGNFASVDTRKMAEKVGLISDYRLVFSPASAAVHGEWGPISQHTLVRCTNPLHRGHRIPDLNMRHITPFSVEFALTALEKLVGDYRDALASQGSE